MHWIQKIKITILVVIVSFVASCVLSTKKITPLSPLPTPDNYGPRRVEQLTQVGTNERPHVSPDGKKLIFVSADRTNHKNYQGYEKDLESGFERRVTHQNGDIFEIQYAEKGDKYIYSSSTDELKENPPYIEKSLLAMKGKEVGEMLEKDDLGFVLPRTEIYQVTLDSSEIERVTRTPLFDGDLSVRGKRHETVFVRWVNSIPSAYVLNMKTKKTSTVGDKNIWTSDPAYSADGEELAWVEKSNDGHWVILTGTAYGENGKMRYQSKSRIRDLVWHPSGTEIFFSENLDDNFELFSLNLEFDCKRRVTFHSALDFHPYPSPDGKMLYFSSNRSGAFQIHRVNLDSLPPCSEPKPKLE